MTSSQHQGPMAFVIGPFFVAVVSHHAETH